MEQPSVTCNERQVMTSPQVGAGGAGV